MFLRHTYVRTSYKCTYVVHTYVCTSYICTYLRTCTYEYIWMKYVHMFKVSTYLRTCTNVLTFYICTYFVHMHLLITFVHTSYYVGTYFVHMHILRTYVLTSYICTYLRRTYVRTSYICTFFVHMYRVDTTLSLVSTQRVMYLSDGKIEATWPQLKFSPGYILLWGTQDNTFIVLRMPMLRNKVTALKPASSRGTIYFLAVTQSMDQCWWSHCRCLSGENSDD